MNILRILREQAKGYSCNVCGTNHSRSEIKVLGRLESAWIVRVTCSRCQTSFKLLVIAPDEAMATLPERRPTARRAAERKAPVSADEVLDAHEILEDYRGDIKALFRRTPATANPGAGAPVPKARS